MSVCLYQICVHVWVCVCVCAFDGVRIYVGLLVCLCIYSGVYVHECMAALMYVSYISCRDLKIFAFKQGTLHVSLIMYCNRDRASTNKRLNMSSVLAEHI